MENIYESKKYKKTANSYNWECAFEYFASIMVTDSFLALLLTKGVGMTDSMAGIVASFVSMAYLFQLLAVPVVRKVTNTKRFAVFFHLFGEGFFLLLYLVPFLPFAAPFRRALVLISVIVGYFGRFFVSQTIYFWGNAFVEPGKRGTFGASKEMRSLLTGLIVQLLSGFAVDYFITKDNYNAAFIFCAASVLVYSVLDGIALLRMDNIIIPAEEVKKGPSFKDILKNTFAKKKARYLLYLSVIYMSSIYVTNSFIGTYKTNELAVKMIVIQIINVAGSLARFALSKPFGRLSDKTSYCTGYFIASAVAAAGYLALMITTPGTWWMVIIFTVLTNISQAGTNQNISLISYDYIDPKYLVEATAIRFGISGIAGFLLSYGCGKLLDIIQAGDNMIFGMRIYGQQIFALFSLVLTVIAMILCKCVIEKQKKITD